MPKIEDVGAVFYFKLYSFKRDRGSFSFNDFVMTTRPFL